MTNMYTYWREGLLLFLLIFIKMIGGQIIQPHNDGDTNDYILGSSYFFYQQPQYPRDCQEVYTQCSVNTSSGVYLIKPDGYPDAFEVYCDFTMNSGGWTIFYRHKEDTIDFERNWREYKNGFGFLSNEFWLGFERLSCLTNQKKYEIRIDMVNGAGSTFYIQYNNFRISDEFSDFRITRLGEYTGTAESVIMFCPTNMEYGNCTCQPTCDDPDNLRLCQTTCSEPDACICQTGFLKEDDACVPPSECGCYIQGEGVISNGQSHVNVDCTSRCRCHSNVMTCDGNYRCSSDATCEERDGVHQCYCNDGYTGDGQNCEVVATDCADIYNANITDSGVYTIKPTNWNGSAFEVYCNMTDGGGWTVFQRRVNGSEDFYLGWNSYKDGFGSPNHELWLGNDKIFYLTNQRNYQLRIDLVYGTGRPYYAKYNLFRINDKNDKYRLVGLGSFSGTAADDRLSWNENKQFSTHDEDNDGWSSYNCAERHRGGWWYAQYSFDTSSSCATSEHYCDWWPSGSNSCGVCTLTNLNGDYNGVTRGTTMEWESSSEYDCDIIYTEMKIKPV
ncbi:Ficolin-1 [Holothuria leucospilota]|uniref:Ficolin-1 n=1 Tax=Holothuria leucospilota TaxID=206669 RepID=A0A9Q1BVS3_HOLLE|nr:Ficolin-1 [Holothuria leucospilota]